MFEWDEEKNKVNRRKHGISFEDILPIFDAAATDGLVVEDIRKEYGETRFILLCPFRGRLFHVTFTWRGDRIRLVSARRANARERGDYEQRKHH